MKRKKLSLHVNSKVEPNAVPSLESSACGVVRVTDGLSELQEFRVRDSQGKRIGFLQIKASEMDDQFLEHIHDWRDRHSHPIPRVVKS